MFYFYHCVYFKPNVRVPDERRARLRHIGPVGLKPALTAVTTLRHSSVPLCLVVIVMSEANRKPVVVLAESQAASSAILACIATQV